MLLASGGCRTTVPKDTAAATQSASTASNRCAVTAVSFVFARYGVHVDRAQIEKTLYFGALSGTPPQAFPLLVEPLGMSCRVGCSDLQSIDRDLRNGLLPIVLLRASPERPIGHYVVVTGRSRLGRYVNTHDDGRPKRVGVREFLASWDRARNLTVVIGRQVPTP